MRTLFFAWRALTIDDALPDGGAGSVLRFIRFGHGQLVRKARKGCAGRQGVRLEPKTGDIGEHGADSFPRIFGLHACAESFFRFAAFTPCQKGQERHSQKRQNQQDNQRDTQDIP